MNSFFADNKLYIATDSLDWVMNKAISQSLSLSTAMPLNTHNDHVPEKPIETLYIHIPFCHTLCRFCSFHKVKFNHDLAMQYFQSLKQEITHVLQQGYRFNRVYIGGGTTTILEDELIKLIEQIKSTTHIREVSCESDPIYFAEGNPQRLVGLVDRMSIGVQSFNDQVLKNTGRYEKFGSAAQQAEYILQANQLFPTVNMDLMYGFKNQTIDDVAYDIEIAKSINPAQITTYPLTLGIGKNRKKAGVLAGNPHQLWPLFQQVKSSLADHYHQEYPWTFSRIQQATDNKYVLDGEDCFGVGSGAFGRFGNQFRISSFNIEQYIELINRHNSGTTHYKMIDDKALMQHQLMIMMGHGYLNNHAFKQHTGKSLWQAFPLELSFLISIGALTKQGQDYRTTEHGEFVALKMFTGFLSGMDWLREQAREINSDQYAITL
ncbi:coproporphyrinogen III oxidase family protein [Shewanella marina]|uniref:coproporphyrinogen III oxidase family protein n=1 Tax=Shewanella marina TaxID=487319 RepID=UPI00046F3792|nr:coproporphyrinogen III oxidase family protein [Shewanella marina]